LPPPGKSPVGPFALGDAEYVGEVLEAAGFASVGSTAHAITVRAPSGAVFDQSSLQLFGIVSERREEALAMVERHLEQFAVGVDEYEYPLAFRVFEAVNR